MFLSFKYLGRMLLAADYARPAVTQNLMKAREVWGEMARILIRDWARPQVSGSFFKFIVHMVLLLGTGNWVVTPHMVQVLGFSQYQVVRKLTGQLPQCRSKIWW